MERDFKGIWIPKEVWLSRELTWLEKAMYVIIKETYNALTTSELSERMGISEKKTNESLKKLTVLNLI